MQPVIGLVDAWGNQVSQAGVTVTAEIQSGTGTLSGTLSLVTDEEGLARYPDLAITGRLSGAHLLRFLSAGLEPAVSGTIMVF